VVAAVTSLSASTGITIIAIVVGGALAAGLVVILGRARLSQSGSTPSGADASQGAESPAGSLIRSWIAITLVVGLLVFCAAALLLDSESLRSTVFGGLIASTAGAIAFYFSSKSADQARSDVLQAAVAISQGAVAPTAFLEKSPPNGTKDKDYSPYRFVANGSPAPIYYFVSAGPAGLLLDPDGTLSGKPTESGPHEFKVAARNAAGQLIQDVTLTVDAT
jgi:hypothetical protein